MGILPKKILVLSGGIAIVMIAMSFVFGKNATGALSIDVKHLVGSDILKLDSGQYKNQLGQGFTVTKFKYYLGQFELLNKNGTAYKSKDYFLIDEEKDESKTIGLNNIEDGEYTGMNFILGVDSANNCSGAQSGALDAVNTMFWTWNTGYIFLKFEGKSPFSTSPGHYFEYHIGGYKNPGNSIRKFNFKFTKPLLIQSGKTNTIGLLADVLELLKSKNTVDFAKLPSVTDTKNASFIADNYAGMFSCQTKSE